MPPLQIGGDHKFQRRLHYGLKSNPRLATRLDWFKKRPTKAIQSAQALPVSRQSHSLEPPGKRGLRFSFDLKSPPRDVRNLRRTVLILHKTTSLAPDGAANRHNLYAIVERLVGLAAIQLSKRGGSLARTRSCESFRSRLSSEE